MNNYGWTPEQDKFLMEKANILSSREIGQALLKNGKTVRWRASRLGISLTGWRYDLDKEFFANLTPISSYWLGVIWADGCLSEYGFLIAVTQRDKEWLNKLRIDIQSTAPIHSIRKRKAVSLGIYSVEIVESLLYYGLKIGNRTHLSLVPKNIPDEYVHHFVRGLFDGDGCSTQYGDYCSRVVVTNTEAMCNWLLGITRNRLGVGGGVYQRKRCNASDWILGGRKQVQKFTAWLYSDADRYLVRKRNKLASRGF